MVQRLMSTESFHAYREPWVSAGWRFDVEPVNAVGAYAASAVSASNRAR